MPAFVPPFVIPSKLMVVGEAPGEYEEDRLRNFVGPSGDMLNKLLKQAGFPREAVSDANVVCFRPPNNDISKFITKAKKPAQLAGLQWSDKARAYAAPFVNEHIDILCDAIKRANPNVILALGNTPLQVLCGETGVTNWRGSILEADLMRKDARPYKVVSSLHPTAILRQYSWSFPAAQDFHRAAYEAQYPEVRYPAYRFEISPNFDSAIWRLDFLLRELDKAPLEISVDIETTRNQIACIGFAWSALEAFCLPFVDYRHQNGCYWGTLEQELALVKKTRQILAHKNMRLIGQNYICYDSIYNWRNWLVFPRVAVDTMTYHHTNWALLPKKIAFQASLFCEYYRYWKDERKGQKEEKKDWNEKQDPIKLWTYNCKDCVITYEVAQVQKKNAENLGRNKTTIYLANGEKHSPISFQMAMGDPSSMATIKGVNIDTGMKARLRKELRAELDLMQARLNLIAGHPLNPRSFPQLKKFFYDDLRLTPVLKLDPKTKRQKPTLDDDALTILAKREPLVRPLVALISNLRSGTVFDSTFLGAKLLDNRFHCTYDRDGTSTYRYASRKDPMGYGNNGQNIPKGFGIYAPLVRNMGGRVHFETLVRETGRPPEKLWKDLLREEELELILIIGKFPNATIVYQFTLPNIRKMFCPDPGYAIGSWDLDRADLQVVAWRACEFDPNGPTNELKQALKEGADLHQINADIIGSTRDGAKIFIHGTNYVGSARTMARHAGVTVHAAEKMQRRYFEARPGIKRWHQDLERQLATTRSIKSIYGFECQFFDRPETLLSKAAAWEPQHTVAMVINIGWMNLYRLHPDIDGLMQVHDELVVQAPALPDMTETTKRVKSALEVVVPFSDPLVIPVSGKWSTKSWAEAKG